MLAFFATIGPLTRTLPACARGRARCWRLPVVVVGLLLMQNAIGIGMASLLGLDPLSAGHGSITLSGGHGTGAAWSKLFVERYGFASATEVAMACATLVWCWAEMIGVAR